MTWQRVQPNHKWQEGQRIRLGGREGKIGKETGPQWPRVFWSADVDNDSLRLSEFPDLEIFVEPVTISKEAAEELKGWMCTKVIAPYFSDAFAAKIDSMTKEETVEESNSGCVVGC